MAATFSLLRGCLFSQRGKSVLTGDSGSRAKPAPLRTRGTFAKGSPAPQPCLRPPWHHHGWASFSPSSSAVAVARARAQQRCRRERRDAASIPSSQCMVLQRVMLTGDFRLLLFSNTSTAAVQLYAICYSPATHPSAGLLAVQVPPSPGQHHFYLGR